MLQCILNVFIVFLLLLACDDGNYGINCTLKCGNCSENAACNKTTGECPSGCSSGWQPPLCNESRCSVQQYIDTYAKITSL